MLNRRNVGTKPHKDVNAYEDFFLLILVCHILAAAMEVFAMDCLDDEPCTEILCPDVWMHEKEERREILHSIAGVIVQLLCQPINNLPTKKPLKGDTVYTYACEVLSLGVLYAEFRNAIQEGDGLCVLRCWRYFLFIFRTTN